MIKVMYSEKGMGKTKSLVDAANDLSRDSKGQLVFLDDSNDLMCKLHYKIRFINISEYQINSADGFFGFISGIISVNFDLQHVFIDGLTYITKDDVNVLNTFFNKLEDISSKHNIDFTIVANGSIADAPEFIKKYVVA